MNEDEERAAYWDWILHTFGDSYYIFARIRSMEEKKGKDDGPK